MKARLLLVEDDKLFAESLEDILIDNGYSIDVSTTAEKALENSYKKRYDLFLLDINLPDINGIELLKIFKDANIDIPTIFLTSYRDDETLKRCFKNGCDDFLRKPFNPEELIFRIEAILKRVKKIEDIFYFDKNLYYNFNSKKIFKDGKEISQPFKVIELIELFIEKNHSIVSFEEIVNRLWSSQEEFSYGSIRLYVSKIREIVGNKIKNIKKIGYEVNF